MADLRVLLMSGETLACLHVLPTTTGSEILELLASSLDRGKCVEKLMLPGPDGNELLRTDTLDLRGLGDGGLLHVVLAAVVKPGIYVNTSLVSQQHTVTFKLHVEADLSFVLSFPGQDRLKSVSGYVKAGEFCFEASDMARTLALWLEDMDIKLRAKVPDPADGGRHVEIWGVTMRPSGTRQ